MQKKLFLRQDEIQGIQLSTFILQVFFQQPRAATTTTKETTKPSTPGVCSLLPSQSGAAEGAGGNRRASISLNNPDKSRQAKIEAAKAKRQRAIEYGNSALKATTREGQLKDLKKQASRSVAFVATVVAVEMKGINAATNKLFFLYFWVFPEATGSSAFRVGGRCLVFLSNPVQESTIFVTKRSRDRAARERKVEGRKKLSWSSGAPNNSKCTVCRTVRGSLDYGFNRFCSS